MTPTTHMIQIIVSKIIKNKNQNKNQNKIKIKTKNPQNTIFWFYF